MYYIRKEIFNPLKVADADALMREFSRADASLYELDQNNFRKSSIDQSLVLSPCRSGRSLSLLYGKNEIPGGTPGGGSASFLQSSTPTTSIPHIEISSHSVSASTNKISTDIARWVDIDIDINFTSYDYMPLLAMLTVQYRTTISGDSPTSPFASDRACTVDMRMALDGDTQGCIATPTNRGYSRHTPTITPMYLNHSFMHTFSSAPGTHIMSAQVRDRSVTGDRVSSSNAPNNYASVKSAHMALFGLAR